jgi:hypothetical protein
MVDPEVPALAALPKIGGVAGDSRCGYSSGEDSESEYCRKKTSICSTG